MCTSYFDHVYYACNNIKTRLTRPVDLRSLHVVYSFALANTSPWSQKHKFICFSTIDSKHKLWPSSQVANANFRFRKAS